MQTDPDLAARFAALRRADHAAAPDFGAVLGRPARPRRTTFAAAAVAAAIIMVVGAELATRRTRVQAEVPTILTWQSPTRGLLPTLDLLRGVPTIHSSVVLPDSGA